MFSIPSNNQSSTPATPQNILNVDLFPDYEELFFDYAETEKDVNPPYTNRGGKVPTTVLLQSHTMSIPPYESFNCHIDYLSFTSRFRDDSATNDQLKIHLLSLRCLIPSLVIVEESKGYCGYTYLIRLKRGDTNIGMVCHGGNGNTLYTSLSGQGCVGLDLQSMHDYILGMGGKITRVDMAHDDLDGNIPVSKFKQQYEAGEFRNDLGGSMPKSKYFDDMGSGEGCTLYVGSLTNGKALCIYEKGKQLGDKDSPWVRVEGRLSSVDRIIPLDVLLRPAEYLAGLYPPLRHLSSKHSFIKMIKKHAEIALESAIYHASIQCGRLINLLGELGLDDTEIVGKLIREGHPARVQIPMDIWGANYQEDDRAYSGMGVMA